MVISDDGSYTPFNPMFIRGFEYLAWDLAMRAEVIRIRYAS